MCTNPPRKIEDANIFLIYFFTCTRLLLLLVVTVQGYTTDVFEFSDAMFAGKLAVPKCWLFVAFNPLSALATYI